MFKAPDKNSLERYRWQIQNTKGIIFSISSGKGWRSKVIEYMWRVES